MTDDSRFDNLLEAIQQAENTRRQGNAQEALQCYLDILKRRLADTNRVGASARWTAADLVVIDRTAELALFLGHLDAADGLMNGMAQLCLREQNVYVADFATVRRGLIALNRGQNEKAKDMLDSMSDRIGDWHNLRCDEPAFSTWEFSCKWPNTTQDDRDVILSQIGFLIGQLMASDGCYASAIAVLQHAQLHTGKNAPALAQEITPWLELALARAELERGNLSRVADCIKDKTTGSGDDRRIGTHIQWLELTGKYHLLVGQYGAAEDAFRGVLMLCNDHELAYAALTAALNLTQVLISLNRTAEAEAMLGKIRATALATGADTIALRANYLLRLATARRLSPSGEVAIASSVLEMWQAPSLFSGKNKVPHSTDLDLDAKTPALPRPSSFLSYFEDQTLSFYYRLGDHDFADAAKQLAQMDHRFGATDSRLIQARLQTLQGMVAYYENRFETAETDFDAAVRAFEEQGLKPDLWQALRFQGWCWTKLSFSDEKRQPLVMRAAKLIDEMTDSLSAPKRAVFLLNKWTDDENVINTKIATLVKTKQSLENGSVALRPWRRWQLMRQINELMHHIDRYKDKRATEYIQGKEVVVKRQPCPSLWRRLMHHPRDRVTISYLVLPDRVLVIQHRWLSLRFSVSPVTRIQIRELVEKWHRLAHQIQSSQRSQRHFGSAGSSPVSEEAGDKEDNWFQITAAETVDKLALALQLSASLANLPQHVRSLTIVPDDSLHGFPFAAISHNGKPLIESYALSVAFENLRDVRERSPALKRTADASTVCLMAVSRGSSQFPPLPNTLHEIEVVAEQLRQLSETTTIAKLADGQATKDSVLSMLSLANLVHVACHGIFEPDRPDQSGFVLMPEPNNVEVVSLRDLAHLDLTQLRLIAITSCWSADHFILPGRWVISLPETLWRSGANSILGSLWAVHDWVAVSLMRQFYHYLSDYDRDEALRRTQLDCLYNRLAGCSSIDTSSPFFWAGYNLYGDPKVLRIGR